MTELQIKGASKDDKDKGVVQIVVNTRPKEWRQKDITFEQVLELAFPGQAYDLDGTTVEYSRGPGKDKSLRPGEKVNVKEGMIFDAEAANRS